MTDTHGSTPGNGPVPPTQGDEHAQHAARTADFPKNFATRSGRRM